MLTHGKTSYCELAAPPKWWACVQAQYSLHQGSQIHTELQGPCMAKMILEKKNKIGTHTAQFQNVLQSYSNKECGSGIKTVDK